MSSSSKIASEMPPHDDATDGVDSPRCRIAIIGAQRARVAKVMSILVADESATRVLAPPPTHASESLDTPTPHAVEIEYLPCVATFDSYTDDKGETVRYLAKIEYHGADGKQILGSSLAPFFEINDGAGAEDGIRTTGGEPEVDFPAVAAVAIGCGIEAESDVTMITSFIQSLSAACMTEKSSETLNLMTVDCIKPNSEYSTMKEENETYKAMAADDKAEATKLRTIGPGKMANFSFSLAERVVHASVGAAYAYAVGGQSSRVEKSAADEEKGASPASAAKDSKNTTSSDDGHESEAGLAIPKLTPRDPDKVQFACKLCRTILFGEEDLEDPPHTKASHEFSTRKHDRGRGRANKCESIFLSGGLDWMGDIGAMEGKLHCPKCNSKVGLWKWAGAQCSCGTWVTPALQIPLSRVDVMAPLLPGPPPAKPHVSPATNHSARIETSSEIYAGHSSAE